MIQADGIFTPWRAHQACGADPTCSRCGHPVADFAHLMWECPVTVKEGGPALKHLFDSYQGHKGEPKCLWNTGHVPLGFLSWPVSHQMGDSWRGPGETHHRHQKDHEVFTDGGCRHGNSGMRAGFGVYWGEGHPLNTHQALPGAIQTAQRAEVAALLWALQQAQSPIKVWSDSKYTVLTAQAAQAGRRHFASHPDLWATVGRRLRPGVSRITCGKGTCGLIRWLRKGLGATPRPAETERTLQASITGTRWCGGSISTCSRPSAG